MPRYVALFRGINLGSHNRIKMADLASALEAAGFANVKTYLQSGNVAFDARASDGLDAKLHDLIHAQFELDIPVIVRSQAEMTAIVAGQPYASDPSAWYVTLLGPNSTDVHLDASFGAPDQARLIGHNIYLEITGNYSDSKLTNAYFERKFGTVATTRNWKTILALAGL